MLGAERRHRKKALKPAIKRELVNYLTTQFTMSIRLACRTLSLVFRYQPNTRRDEAVIQRLTEVAERYPRYGFKKLFQVLRRQGARLEQQACPPDLLSSQTEFSSQG